MQPYRRAKPHASGDCVECAPNSPGHHLCQGPDGCNEIASAQTIRHLTQAEFDAIPEAFKPIDGYATKPVFGCEDCAEDGQFEPFCEHAPTPAPPCPKCGAEGDASCTKKDRTTPRTKGPHSVRTGPVVESCHHAHREDGEVFAGCQCADGDQAPTRTLRGAGPATGPDIAGLAIPLYVAQMVLHQAGFPWANVVSARSIKTQDNRDAIGAQVYQTDPDGHRVYDDHGHSVVLDVVVPLSALMA